MFVGDCYESTGYGKFTVIEINSCRDILVRFNDTGFESRKTMGDIRLGSVKDLLKASVLGVGCIGDGKYTAYDKAYSKWFGMLERCYIHKDKSSGYVDCTVCEEWHNYQTFAEWVYSKVDSLDGMHLDKDMIQGGNREYSPELCSIITAKENLSISRKTSIKPFDVVSPTGIIHTVDHLSRFCRKHDLMVEGFSKIKGGSRKQYKGWRLKNATTASI